MDYQKNSVRYKRTWERRADDAKHRHRPKLKDWSRDQFATRRQEEFHALRVLESELNTNIARLDSKSVSAQRFREDFEGKNIPCIISGVPTTEHWNAVENWTFKKLAKRYGNQLFKAGEDDDGYKIKMKLKYFIKYLCNNQDDSPLYVFDSNFYEVNNQAKTIMDDFSCPSYFPEDLFALTGMSCIYHIISCAW
jgi:histone arginine demethylase JMJD6